MKKRQIRKIDRKQMGKKKEKGGNRAIGDKQGGVIFQEHKKKYLGG